MSLLLWTARSTSFLSSASSISLTKSRLPPASDSGRSAIVSPDVLMTTMRQGGPPRSATAAATAWACHSASGLPRVPSRSSWGADATSALVARPRARERLHAAGRALGGPLPDALSWTPRSGGESASPNTRAIASAYSAAVSGSPSALSCSVGVSSSFSTIRCVISSTRARASSRASGGRPDSLKSSRSSSARRIDSNDWRSATTVGMTPRARSHEPNLSSSSSTMASARVTSLVRRARFSRTDACRSSML